MAGFGGLDFFGGDKSNDLHCPECKERRGCPEPAKPGDHKDRCAFREEIDVEDNQVVILELEDGIKASYLQSHFTPDYQRNYTFIGTEGRLENSQPEGKVWVKTRRSDKWKELADRTYHIKEASGSHGGADPVICQDFVDMILDGKKPVADPWSGRISVAAGCAAAKSIRSGGKPVKIDS